MEKNVNAKEIEYSLNKNNLRNSIQQLYEEKEINNILKLIVFSRSLKFKGKGTVDSFPSDKDINEFLQENANLSIDDLNNLFQDYFLTDTMFGKVLIHDRRNVRIMERYSEELKTIFKELGLWEGIDTTNKINNKITQIRILGTNHIFAAACLKDFKNKIIELKNNNLLSDDCKIILLTGDHKNKGFIDDDYTENKEFDLLFSEEFAGLKVENCVSEKKSLFKRANTIDTIIKADKEYPNDGNILYLGQPIILNRQRTDIFVHYKKNNQIEKFKNTYYYSSDFEKFKRNLSDNIIYDARSKESVFLNEHNPFKSKKLFYKRINKIMNKELKLLELDYSLCLDSIARSNYAQIKSGFFLKNE